MRNGALFQLILLRFREFIREPEAVFWNLAFPVLLAGGLGVAFRDQPADVFHVAAVNQQLAQSLRNDKELAVDELTTDAALTALRNGKVVLIAEPGANGAVTFRYDDTNPVARNARLIVDRALQVAAGRTDPVTVSNTILREPGS